MIRGLLKDTKAQAMVESAIVLPVFLMVVFSILQLGLIFNAKFLVNYAAYSGCRIGIVRQANQDEMKKGVRIVLATLEKVTANTNELVKAAEDLSSTIDDNLTMNVEENNPTNGVLYVHITYNFNLIIPFGNAVIWNILNVSGYMSTTGSYMKYMELEHHGEYRIPVVGECRMRIQS
jgi:Flp pilus assembly protein TadG